MEKFLYAVNSGSLVIDLNNVKKYIVHFFFSSPSFIIRDKGRGLWSLCDIMEKLYAKYLELRWPVSFDELNTCTTHMWIG